MATVWEATHLALNRRVAVKLVHLPGVSPAQARERFLREARVAAAVRHRNVVDILDFGTDEDGRPFMVMELLVGRPLSGRLEEAPIVGVEEAVHIMAGVLSGLAAVHDAAIIHRDLKPENVFLVEDEEGVSPKLLDFGVSRALDSRGGLKSVLPTVENAIVGTPHYMSPEQARGLRTVDHRSDLWSAGVMLFELLTGTLPFDGDASGDVIIRIATSAPPRLSVLRAELAGPLERLVDRALSRVPGDRFPTARAMHSALLVAAAGAGAGAVGVEPETGAPARAAGELPTDEDLDLEPREPGARGRRRSVRSWIPTVIGRATPAGTDEAGPSPRREDRRDDGRAAAGHAHGLESSAALRPTGDGPLELGRVTHHRRARVTALALLSVVVVAGSLVALRDGAEDGLTAARVTARAASEDRGVGTASPGEPKPSPRVSAPSTPARAGEPLEGPRDDQEESASMATPPAATSTPAEPGPRERALAARPSSEALERAPARPRRRPAEGLLRDPGF